MYCTLYRKHNQLSFCTLKIQNNPQTTKYNRISLRINSKFIALLRGVFQWPPYGRGWPGSSGQHRLRPCHPPLPFIAKVARTSPAYGRGWPGSSGQHCLRPGTYPLLPTPAGAVHTQTFNQHQPPCACQDCPPANSSLRSPSLRLRVQLIYLPA